jgi:hypothetical protein
MKETTTVTLKPREAAILENELRELLKNRFSQYEKYKIGQTLKVLQPVAEGYRDAQNALFEEHSVVNPENGKRHIPHLVQVDGAWVDNPQFVAYKAESDKLDADTVELQLRTIPVGLLKQIEDECFYELAFQYLVVETPVENPQ